MKSSRIAPPKTPDVKIHHIYSEIWKGSILASLLFLPAMISFLFRETSFSVGTVLAVLFAFSIFILTNRSEEPYNAIEFFVKSILIALFVLFHLLISNIINNDPSFNIIRAIYLIPVFILIVFMIPILSKILFESNGPSLKTAQLLCVIFIIISILSLLKIQPATESYGEKPIFPYTEPSFLGFSVCALLIFTVTLSSVYIKFTILIISLIIAYSLSNLTIVFAILLVASIGLPTYIIIMTVLLLFSVQSSLDLTYYLDRLNFDWERSFNISTLVYVQGWQLIEESFSNTWGWGVGFQQLGVVSNNVLASYRIMSLIGRDANILDGGFILSKLLSEFGIFGVMFSAAYSWIAARSFFVLRKVAAKKELRSDGEVFAYSCIVGYSIELFVRGSSYFSGTFVLLLASLLFLWRRRVGDKFSQNSRTSVY